MKKIAFIIFFVILAIPIPISVISWLGTLIAVAGGIGTVNWSEALDAVIMIVFFVFFGIYPFTYIFSLMKSKKRICWWNILPIIHILIVIVFLIMLPDK